MDFAPINPLRPKTAVPSPRLGPTPRRRVLPSIIVGLSPLRSSSSAAFRPRRLYNIPNLNVRGSHRFPALVSVAATRLRPGRT